MQQIDTGWQQIATSGSTSGNGLFMALTGAMSSVGLGSVQLTLEQSGVVGGEVKPAVQYSDDGVSWSAGNVKDLWSSWETADRVAEATWHTIPPSGADRPFVRFGVRARRATSGSAFESHSVRLLIRAQPIAAARTVKAGPMVVATGDGATEFRPMTDPMPLRNIAKVRYTWRNDGSTPACQTLPAYEVSSDGIIWTGLATSAHTTLEGDGLQYPNSTVDWEDVTDDEEFVRFGVQVSRGAGALDVEMCTCTMRIDLRGE